MDSTIIVAIITIVGTIINTCISKRTDKKIETIQDIKKEFKEELEKVQKENRENMDKHILEADKTHLTNFLSELESGTKKSEIQIKRAYEIYEEYTLKHGNSYIHDKWEELKGKGLL